jgi:hypothetical protein
MIKALSKTKAKILAGYMVVNRGDGSKFKIQVNNLVNTSLTRKIFIVNCYKAYLAAH